MFKKPFSVDGRIRRLEYGLSYILYLVFSGVLSTLMEVVNPSLLLLVFIPAVWFLVAQGAKRCHDRGNSGWYQIIPLYVIWMLFADSENGQNKYGPNPKGIGNN